MNKQDKGKGSRGIEWTEYTWNPVGGCKHGCRWTMPDGSIARCYAESVAISMRSDKFYPDGFEAHYWNPDRLEEPLKLKAPSRIFLDSMSDLMGHWVPAEQIEAVLDVCRRAPQHIFQLLTKNPVRLKQFTFPQNVWVGVSAPPSEINGKPLDDTRRAAYLTVAFKSLDAVDVPIRWMSIEPLSFDIGPFLKDAPIQWAVIGAATNGKRTFYPDAIDFSHCVEALDVRSIPVFYKGNLKGFIGMFKGTQPWREEYPAMTAQEMFQL